MALNSQPTLTVKERDLYYYGLPSRPRLVARSSTAPWEIRWCPWNGTCRHGKKLHHIGQHPIAEAWNPTSGPLRRAVIAELRGVDWTSIDILRIGWERENTTPTMFISVTPGSVSHQDGLQIVHRIKQILTSHGLQDIECDMKEAFGQEAALVLSKSVRAGKLGDESIQLSDCLGTSIFCIPLGANDAVKWGTKGLYFRLHKQDNSFATVALTCRHVVFAGEHDDGEEYRYREGMPRRTVMQIDSDRMRYYKTFLAIPDQHSESVDSTSKDLLDRFSQIENPQSRTIGHVLFSPKSEICHRDGGWFRDWALIELDENKHEAITSGTHPDLTNRIFLGDRTNARRNHHKTFLWGPEDQERTPCPDLEQDGTFHLSDKIVPKSRIRPSTSQSPSNPLVVAKYGSHSGLTFGIGNEAFSVTRQPHNSDMAESEEWCIISGHLNNNGWDVFSHPGDSGSIVWDMAGQVAGLITSGVGEGIWLDVTHATPMYRVLDDIKAHGFDISLP